MSIENTKVIVTGAADGIGLEYVKQLLKNGAKQVAILDIDEKRGEEAAKILNKSHGPNKVFFLHCNVAKKEDQEDKFQKAVEKLGGLDIIINNAGIMQDSQWELSIDLNLKSVARGTIFGIELMGKHKGGKGGTIVNIASIAGLMPVAACPVYAGTKAGVIAMTRSFGDEINMNRYGVRVMAMCPGATDTALVTKAKIKQRSKEDNEAFSNLLSKLINQSPSNVAENMMTLIKTGQSADIFVCEDNEPLYKINIPDYHKLKC